MVTNKTKLNIVITRPEPQGLRLADDLTRAGYSVQYQPLFSYQAKANSNELSQLLTTSAQPKVIFVSAAAAEYAEQLQAIANWPVSEVFAVGKKTQQQLLDYRVKQVISPEQEDSEGLLQLAALQQVSGDNIIIVRGDSGRELLATELAQRGATVHYLETYQRYWLPLDGALLNEHWQQQQINCIVATSSAMLERVVELISPADSYWQQDCLWLVASERIAQRATELGLRRVVNTQGASNQAILTTLAQQG